MPYWEACNASLGIFYLYFGFCLVGQQHFMLLWVIFTQNSQMIRSLCLADCIDFAEYVVVLSYSW